MRKNVVLPFRFIRSSSSAVKPSEWFQCDRLGDNAKWLLNGTGVEDWSYDTPFFVGRDVEIDTNLMASELGLADSNATFELLHTISISNLGIRKILHRESFQSDDGVVSSFFQRLDSSELCEHIVLHSAIMLKNDLTDVPRWAPSKRGSTCWNDETRVPLEGFGSRFPMQDLEFSKHHKLPNQASWHLDWRPGLLHYSFNSAVTLYLNSEKVDFFDRIQEGDDVLIEQVMSAITGEICGYLLEREEFMDEDSNYPDGSLGKVALTWLSQAMPGLTLPEIKNTFIRSPNTIHTALRGLAANI